MKYFIYLIGVLTLGSCNSSESKVEADLEKKALEIHKEIITIDTHNDINIKYFTDNINYTQRLETQVNIPKMKEGGLDVVWLIVYTAQDSLTSEGYGKAEKNAMAKFEAIHNLCEDIAPDQIELALTAQEVTQIVEAGKKVAMIGVENAYPLGSNLSNFERYHKLGARYISLAHNGHNQFSDSHTGEQDDKWLHNGLSDLGKSAVTEMNRLGIIIDVSHLSKLAMMQMAALSKAPILASHSSARALCDHSRNLDDEQLQILKKNGGVVQTVAFGSYLNAEKDSLRRKYMNGVYKQLADSLDIVEGSHKNFGNLSDDQKEEYLENHPVVVAIAQKKAANESEAPEAVNVGDFIDHGDYMVNLIGIDHVGISSDFDGGGGIQGWSDASETFNVTLELVKRGYTKEEISKLW